MRRCIHCGGRLLRIHRSLAERVRYMAVWQCADCNEIVPYPRQYATHLGPHSVCPLCTTPRLTRLEKPDRIDRQQGGFWNLLERLAGGRLYHCRFCRLQFYDRRKMLSELERPEAL